MPAGAGISRKQSGVECDGSAGKAPGAGPPTQSSPLRLARMLWRATQKEAAMEVRKRSDAKEEAGSDPSPDSSRNFGTMVDAGSGYYLRA